ncbi:hypothetical protein G5C66_07830 [Nocardioides sp. KC13]|uniref:Uncharacterized protein n=1 Tax=Nocardioides turkmenicus TaxID=2711220 RepID=A0A6M1QXU0_9ACTN|nr:hypothetical protein [Nocardioides sp. KC13]NGN92646.1 hypothetical protein [Nocardioides sp. KC13]
MTSEKTADEVFESLNGFDEIAIEKAFGEITSLKDKPMMFLRALLFTEHRREGKTDKEAKQAAMDATMRELTDYFRADEDIDAGEA